MHKILQKFNIILLLSLILIFTGCSRKNTELLISEPAKAEETEVSADEAQIQEDSEPQEEKVNSASTGTSEEIISQNVLVHVCGAVQAEGVYELEAGSRVIDAVTAAGGFSEGADTSYVNQAQILEDGVKLRIPTIEEIKALTADNSVDVMGADTLEVGVTGNATVTDEGSKSSLVNINTATEAELCEIPGIGPSRAQSIIEYRGEYGKFGTIEDIMNVTGIKDKFFAKIKDHITV